MAKEAKHTPGPWMRSDYGQIVNQNGKDICFRSVTTLGSGSEESLAEAEANTDLIAAAPDLLEALMELAYSDEWHKNAQCTEELVWKVQFFTRYALHKSGALKTQDAPETLEVTEK